MAINRRKSIRLPLASYDVKGLIWHITIVTENRHPCFANDIAFAQTVADQLLTYSDRYDIQVHAWCLMPDNLHAILQTGDRGLLPMINAFKSRTTNLSRSHGMTGKLWQTSFHDHGIRQVEDFDAAVEYLYRNPERAGLTDSEEGYRWRGGLMFDSPDES